MCMGLNSYDTKHGKLHYEDNSLAGRGTVCIVNNLFEWGIDDNTTLQYDSNKNRLYRNGERVPSSDIIILVMCRHFVCSLTLFIIYIYVFEFAVFVLSDLLPVLVR